MTKYLCHLLQYKSKKEMAEQIRIRDNGKLNKIKIPSDKLEVVQKIVKSNVSDSVKENIIKQLSGGVCCICRAIPTQEVIYNVGDATRIERYCDRCIKTIYERHA
jgi:hypothetical protein